uniref:Uncharacterized protein n=1 Tax=Trichuris muris TaxID=70415 RepID=A0A5S6QFK9_TRIMR
MDVPMVECSFVRLTADPDAPTPSRSLQQQRLGKRGLILAVTRLAVGRCMKFMKCTSTFRAFAYSVVHSGSDGNQ